MEPDHIHTPRNHDNDWQPYCEVCAEPLAAVQCPQCSGFGFGEGGQKDPCKACNASGVSHYILDPEFEHLSPTYRIQHWRVDDPGGWLKFCESQWDLSYGSWKRIENYDGLGREQRFPGTAIRFATGGWSENEEIVMAMQKNVLWHFFWKASLSGGLYILEERGV